MPDEGRRAGQSAALLSTCGSIRAAPTRPRSAPTGSSSIRRKRSSATRRRDRTKLKRLGEIGRGEIRRPGSERRDRRHARRADACRRANRSPAWACRTCSRGPATRRSIASLRRAAQRSLVHLSRLDVGATWAAVNLGLTFRDCYYHVLASYDDGEVSRFGPGAAHLRELLRYAIDARDEALRLHHRRRALQARLVRDRAAAVRLFGRRDAPRLAFGRDFARLAAHQARHQADRAVVERGAAPAQRRSRRCARSRNRPRRTRPSRP